MLGLGDRNLKIIRETLGVKVAAREGNVQISGESDAVAAAREVLGKLGDAAEQEVHLSRQQVLDLVGRALATGGRDHRRAERDGPAPTPQRPWEDRLDVYADGQPIL